MAYLSPKRLTCPICGFTGDIEVIVSVGPQSRKGDVAGRGFRDPGPFRKNKDADGLAILACPHDGTQLWANTRTLHAFGPLTEAEMRSPRARAWLVPGTENPVPPKPVPFHPKDPFSGPRPVKPT